MGATVFLADPDVGGRYSALTAFGVVPSALAGVDVAEFPSRGNVAKTNPRPAPRGRRVEPR